MDHIKKLSTGMLRNEATTKAARAAFVCSEAKKAIREVMGGELAQHIAVVSYRDGLVSLSAKDPVCAQEVALKRTDIMRRTNELIGAKTVRDIRFKGRVVFGHTDM